MELRDKEIATLQALDGILGEEICANIQVFHFDILILNDQIIP